MAKTKKGAVQETFARVADRTAAASGSFWAFSAAAMLVVGWALTGPMFSFSETWQLFINTGTTIITFLMVFLIQHAQNKENRALQLKLDELIAAVEGASNRLIDVEDLSDRELDELYGKFRHLAKTAKKLTPGARTSVEAERAEGRKRKVRSKKSTSSA